jgi:uncharacterized protein (TIGR00369 family)
MALQSPTGGIGVVPREVATAMTGLEFLEKLRDGALPAPPFAEETNIWITEVERGRVAFEARPSPRFLNPLGTVHGGWIATVLDSAMGCAVHSVLKAGQAYTTVDMSVSFVRPVFAKTGVLRCEGKLIHAGKTIATSEARLWDQTGTLIAHASETCLVLGMTTATSAVAANA